MREAASALDTSLLLINNILKVGIDQTKVKWGRLGNEGPLRKALEGRSTKQGKDFVTMLDSVFGSIGYELLVGYRHWVTHRGAPIAVMSPDLSGPLPVPDEARKEVEPARRNWLIETHLMMTVPFKIAVQCWPFCPPVQTVVNATIDEAESDVELPGVHIAKGSRNVTIKDMRVVAGDLSMDAEEFKAKNPILLDKHRVRVAGEELAVYMAMDYTHAVASATRFVTTMITGKWDDGLKALCESYLSPSSSVP